MALYIIDYDLNSPGKNYNTLLTAIKAYGSWAKTCKYSWIIRTEKKSSDIRDNLMKHIDENDTLFVAELSGQWASYGLLNDVVNWLNK